MNGFTGNDVVDGGAGRDTIGSSVNDDVLTGGVGADRFDFVVANGLGTARITDFEVGVDHLAYWGLSYTDLGITNDASGTVIAWHNGSVTLDGVDASSLTQDDFMFL